MFVRAASPIWFFNNLTGQVLDDTYWAFFLTNTLPYVPQPVYQDPNGTPWSDPIEFQPSGGLPNNLYFDPLLVYRIEIRKGRNQTDPLIWLIENFVPNGSGSSFNTNFENSQNLITNPQFAYVNFTSPYTIKTPGTYNIAPGWQLILTGSGVTTVLNQINLPGQDDITVNNGETSGGNPPYELKINNNGWSSASLVQTFNFNGALFANGSVAMSILAMPDTTAQTITLNYKTSEPVTVTVASRRLPAGIYSLLSGINNIDASNNANLDSAAFTQMEIILQPTGIIHITNVQFIGQSVQVPDSSLGSPAPLFQEESIELETDHLFHYYAESILVLPKKSLAVGWHFRNNPWQFNNGAIPITVSTTPLYTADQTIVVASTVNSIQVFRTPGSVDIPYGLLQIAAVNPNAQGHIAVFQFIDSATIRPFFGYSFSVLVRARIVTTQNTKVKLKVRAFTINGPVEVMTNVNPIASWDATTGDPVFSASYSPIAPENDPAYVLQNNFDKSSFNGVCPPMAFNNFFINPNKDSNSSATIGIMIYTVDPLGIGATPDIILIDEISFVPNPFAMDTIAQTADEVLRECQFYYEKSYDVGVIPGSATNAGAISGMMSAVGSGEISFINASFKVTKRITPVFNTTPGLSQFIWYSPGTGAPGNIYNATIGADANVSTTTLLGQGGAGWPTISGGAGVSDGNTVSAHWVCDVRPGLH